jgi:hypothetical protein
MAMVNGQWLADEAQFVRSGGSAMCSARLRTGAVIGGEGVGIFCARAMETGRGLAR